MNHEDTKLTKTDPILGDAVATATTSCAKVFTRRAALRVLRSSWLLSADLGQASILAGSAATLAPFMTAPAAPAPAPAPRPLGRTRFTSELEVRPDDIDMFQHVHSSRYLDYVLAARFDQMARCYGMSMKAFLELGLAWFQRSAHIEFKRPLRLGDRFTVTTWIEELERDTVRVEFQIHRHETERPAKLACDGHCHYTLVNVATQRAEPIPDWIAAKYGV